MRRPATIVLVGLGLCLGGGVAAQAQSSGTPYQDPSAVGQIGLCDQSGHEVTSGQVAAKPFVWRAVSTAPAKAPYDGAGRSATLFAYQPRAGVAPGDWSGDQLTATANYTNPAHPMAQATGRDESLAAFISEFTPSWDGLLQLRIFLGAPGQAAESFNYPATSIQVTGSTWHVVDPVTVSCTSGRARSIESVLLSNGSTSHHHNAADRRSSAHRHARQTNSQAASSKRVSTPEATNAAATTTTGNGSFRPVALTIGLLAGLAVLLVVTYRFRRGRIEGSG